MKRQILVFLKYQSHHSRLIKKIFATAGEYVAAAEGSLVVGDGNFPVSFHQGDGIFCEQVVNADFEDFVFDYLVTYSADDQDQNVASRWFVISKSDNRKGQVNVSLKRDLVSDYWADLKKADFMMERGNLDFGEDGDDWRAPDPLLFQPEDQVYNQIKKEEYKLYRFGYPSSGSEDDIEPAWLVGYIPKNLTGWQTVRVPAISDIYAAETLWGIDLTPTFGYEGVPNNEEDAYNIIAMPLKDCMVRYNATLSPGNWRQYAKVSLAVMSQLAAKGFVIDLQLLPYIPGETLGSQGSLAGVASWNPGDGIYTSKNFMVMTEGIQKGFCPGDAAASYQTGQPGVVDLPSDWNTGGSLESFAYVSDSGQVQAEAKNVRGYVLKSWTFQSGTLFFSSSDYSFDNSTMKITFVNQYYNGFIDQVNNGLGHFEIVYRETSASAPFTPVIFALSTSRETFEIGINSQSAVVDSEISPDDLKKEKATKTYRIVSPNHDGVYEWTPAMNYNFVLNSSLGLTEWKCDFSRFTAAIALKPFDPYIRIQPNYSFADSSYTVEDPGFYGGNFDDARGLICGGDFSLSRMSSVWEEYKLNNKNFASSFSRGIQSMETRKVWQAYSDVIGLGGATVGGAIAGGLKGGVPGAIGGAVAGLGSGLFSGLKNQALAEEAINAAKSQWSMNISAIQARPESLTKVSAFDPDNKIWPFLEIYDCTDEEKNLFEKRMIMTGMAGHKFTTLENQMKGSVAYPLVVDSKYYQRFEGIVVKMPEGVDADPAMIEEISREMRMGLFIALDNFLE